MSQFRGLGRSRFVVRSEDRRTSCVEHRGYCDDMNVPPGGSTKTPPSNYGDTTMPEGVPCVGAREGEQRLGLGFYSLEWSCQEK